MEKYRNNLRLPSDRTLFLSILKNYGKYGLPWNEVAGICRVGRIKVENVCSLLLKNPSDITVRNGRIIHPDFE